LLAILTVFVNHSNTYIDGYLASATQGDIESGFTRIVSEVHDMESKPNDGPDFASGVEVKSLPDGAMIQGRFGGEDVILARRGNEFFAVGANCTHYGGPLVKGLLIGDEVRCPLHHACFSLRTGEALRAPAFDPIPCWRVERIGEQVFLRDKLTASIRKRPLPSAESKIYPSSVVIVGGGAAGLAAADMLRREGYDKPITILSADDSAPYDRPNLSKDYLAGTAPDEWIPLRSPDYYRDQEIQLVLNSHASSVDVPKKRIRLDNGNSYEFGALLLATGADPVRLSIPGASDSQLHYLRTFADSRTLAQKAISAKQVVLVGASFIALEVAASLRARGIVVHVVAPEQQPLERVMGSEVGSFIRALHEAQGVFFHLGETVTRVEGRKVTLSGGLKVDADFLVLGVGVRPSLALAEQAGLKTDRGVVVNDYLETSVPGIFAAGDIARWPDPHSGGHVRIEHWVVAERQGQVAARNILGQRERFDAVPFFWTQQYDVAIKYVGHAEKWDAVEISGSLDARDCAVTYKLGGRRLAVATISRDLQSLQVEAAMETSIRSV
jgi:NADPH-dependent 2,4-dienoyl-CoA reductase/sulfur reductase-like enzyme/nitrite reductase/ring-hydroxylating ferredoxin subunit